MQPVIVYVDDEANNLTVFEAICEPGWSVHCFDNPLTALSRLKELDPWVIITDQRMPGMKGVEFLSLAAQLVPLAVRMIVTGYSDEDLVISSVTRAQVFDYIKKPWEPEHLEQSLERAIAYYRVNRQKEEVLADLAGKREELERQARDLEKARLELELARHRESEMRRELECWVPPFVLWALKNPQLKFPIQRDIVGITFDIIGSSRIHGMSIDGKPLRAAVIQLFSESILRHGGFRESHSGDSAYAHFGLMDGIHGYGEAALAAAREFRVALRGLNKVYQTDLECGIALHAAHDAVVDIHTVHLKTPAGAVTQKSFDTTSNEIDLLHRIEKLVHRLPGSNIIMTESFIEHLSTRPEELIYLGSRQFTGQDRPVKLYLIRSDMLSAEDLRNFIREEFPLEPLALPEQPRTAERSLTLNQRVRAQYHPWNGPLLLKPARTSRTISLPLRPLVRQLKAS
ncbi:response regulator [Oligoflexus tunisiensis]|uniref:response regulator n=1 Tax=Oligoflexus tunisiensis TaxID=708132 RepID=UPI00114CCA80|nr:response regulator [Oligoflexus tunisiensis]